MTHFTILSHDPDEAVRWLTDLDVIRMPIEVSQILLTIWHRLKPGTFGPTLNYLEGDPWLEWVVLSEDNYTFMWNYGMDLVDEHFHRFGSRVQPNYRHGIHRYLDKLGAIPPLPKVGAYVLPIQPEQARLMYDPRGTFAVYTHREAPVWT